MSWLLSKEDDRFQKALWDGVISNDSDNSVLVAPSGKRVGEAWEFVSVEHASGTSRVKAYFQSIRAISLTATLMPGVVAALVTYFDLNSKGESYRFDFLSGALSLVAILLLQVVVNVKNDVEDHVRGIDDISSIGSSRVIQGGVLTARQMNRFAMICLFLGVLLSLPVFYFRGWDVAVFALLGVILSLQYSSGFLQMKYRGLGDVGVFLTCGPLLGYGFGVAFGLSLTQSLQNLGIGLSSSLFGMLAVGILHANNLNDLNKDEKTGAKTLAVRLGFQASRSYLFFIYGSSLLMALLGCIWVNKGLFLFLPALISIPFFVTLIRKVKKSQTPEDPILSTIRFEAAQGHFMVGVLLCIGAALYVLF